VTPPAIQAVITMTDSTDTTTVESSSTDDQQPRFDQSKTKTTVEFFREKFADDEETEPVWIDPKGGNAIDESEVGP
jgi:hypothetical protein